MHLKNDFFEAAAIWKQTSYAPTTPQEQDLSSGLHTSKEQSLHHCTAAHHIKDEGREGAFLYTTAITLHIALM